MPFGPLLKKLKEGKDIIHDGKKYLAKNLTYSEGDKKVSIVLDTLKNEKIVPFVKNSDYPDLMKIIPRYDRVLKQMKKDGTLKMIAEKYSK